MIASSTLMMWAKSSMKQPNFLRRLIKQAKSRFFYCSLFFPCSCYVALLKIQLAHENEYDANKLHSTWSMNSIKHHSETRVRILVCSILMVYHLFHLLLGATYKRRKKFLKDLCPAFNFRNTHDYIHSNSGQALWGN